MTDPTPPRADDHEREALAKLLVSLFFGHGDPDNCGDGGQSVRSVANAILAAGFRRVAPEPVREETCDACGGTGFLDTARERECRWCDPMYAEYQIAKAEKERDEAFEALARSEARAEAAERAPPEPQQQGGEDYDRGFRDGLAEAFRIVDAEWYDQHSTQRHDGEKLCADLMERLRKRFAAPAPAAPAGVTIDNATAKMAHSCLSLAPQSTDRDIAMREIAAALAAQVKP